MTKSNDRLTGSYRRSFKFRCFYFSSVRLLNYFGRQNTVILLPSYFVQVLNCSARGNFVKNNQPYTNYNIVELPFRNNDTEMLLKIAALKSFTEIPRELPLLKAYNNFN